jgi:hypothetical protein
MGSARTSDPRRPGSKAAGAATPAAGAAPGEAASTATGAPRESSLRVTMAALAGAPRPLAGASVLVAAQGLLVVALGILQVVRGFGHHIDNLARAEFGGVLTLLCGVVVLALAQRIVVDRTASRSPIVVIELLCLPVGWAMADNGLYGYAIPLLAVAVAILALLLAAGVLGRRAGAEQPPADGAGAV